MIDEERLKGLVNELAAIADIRYTLMNLQERMVATEQRLNAIVIMTQPGENVPQPKEKTITREKV